MKSALFTLALALATSALLSAEPTATATATATAKAKAKAVDLRVESQTDPTAVNTPVPRFSWRTETDERGWLQTAYKILVASTPELLAEDIGDLWDSGDTPFRSSILIWFRGAPLKSGQKCFWKVRCKDRNNLLTSWSAPGSFTIHLGPTNPQALPLFSASESNLSSFNSNSDSLNSGFTAAQQQLSKIATLRDTSLTLRSGGFHSSLLPRGRTLARQLRISVDDAGFYPAKIPSDGSYGSTRSDAGISCVHSLWWMTGDTDLLTRAWPTMNSYAAARMKVDPKGEGTAFGDLPADSLPQGDPTPPEFIHLMSQAINIRLLKDMVQTASQNPFEQKALDHHSKTLGKQLQLKHITKTNELKHNSITAFIYALRSGLLNQSQIAAVSQQLLTAIQAQKETSPLDQGPYATTYLLPVLTWTGNVDLAVKIASEYPVEGGTPLAHLAISEWLISMIGGIDANESGFRSLRIRPHIPSRDVLQFADAKYLTPNGPAQIHWTNNEDHLNVKLLVPPNTIAYVTLPYSKGGKITEKDGLLKEGKMLFGQKVVESTITFRALPGSYSLTITN